MNKYTIGYKYISSLYKELIISSLYTDGAWEGYKELFKITLPSSCWQTSR